VLTGVRLSRHYLGAMKQRNWGRIVFISSESALQVPDSLRDDEDGATRDIAGNWQKLPLERPLR